MIKKGFSLIEMMLVIVIISFMMTLKYDNIKKENEQNLSKGVSQQLIQISTATNSFINMKYNDIINYEQSFIQDLICTKNLCSIQISTLVSEHLLPDNYLNKNIYGSDYSILIKKEGTAPNYILNGIVALNSPLIDPVSKKQIKLLMA